MTNYIPDILSFDDYENSNVFLFISLNIQRQTLSLSDDASIVFSIQTMAYITHIVFEAYFVQN